MTSATENISVAHARELAEESARGNLKHFVSNSSIPLLRSSFLEAEFCWIFFRNESIEVPADKALAGNWAYAVSKKGAVRQIADLSDDSEKMLEYLKKMSKYFEDHKQ